MHKLIFVCVCLFQTVREFLPAMLEKNKGHILNVASMSAKSGTAFLVDYRYQTDTGCKFPWFQFNIGMFVTMYFESCIERRKTANTFLLWQ
jgi:hypothetical protein